MLMLKLTPWGVLRMWQALDIRPRRRAIEEAEADLMAMSPAAWTRWKGELLAWLDDGRRSVRELQ